MKLLNCSKIRIMFFGVMAAMMLIGVRANAVIIISEPTNLGPVINHARGVQACDFSHDGLELYLAFYNRSGGFGDGDIWVSTRETLDSPWQEPANLGSNVNSGGSEVEPSISSDGLELYFGCWQDYILRVCTRPSKDDPWSKPMKIGPPVGSTQPAMEIGSDDAWRPDISSDGLSLYFSSTRAGGYGGTDIWMARRVTTADPWTAPVNLGPNVNTAVDDVFPNISADGLTLVFNRGFASIYATTRKSIEDDWGPDVQLGIRVPSHGSNFHSAALSPDGSALYFEAAADWGGYGGGDFWQVTFTPIVDFNSDGIVDIADLVALIEHWGQEDHLYDIGPLPLGDGIVDVNDLEVLMSYWQQEILPPELAAYWKLDETECNIAHDNVGNNHGVLSGNPTWQPDSGHVDGALQFDGIDDYISTPFVLNPNSGPFSVFTWIKGGGSGQVIISQRTGTGNIWLGLDAQYGALMTGLVPPSSGWIADKKPLVSEFIITDDQWHHVGFVWDGSYRILYADGIEVAKDTAAQNPLKPADGGLYIGTDKMMQPGTYWSGLIDDVRIYNKALSTGEIAALAQ